MSVLAARALRALSLLALALAPFVVHDARAQTSLDCGEPLCAAILDVPESMYSGAKLDFRVAYRFQEGEYPDGITIAIDSPEYFVAANVPETDVWRPYLNDGTADPALCVLEQADPWDVRCGVRRGPITIANNVDPGTFTVSMHSEPYDTPRDYLAEFSVTISGTRVQGGQTTFESHTASATVRMVAEANPNLGPAGQLVLPTAHADYRQSEGMTVPSGNGSIGFVPDVDHAGDVVQGASYSISEVLRNRIMPRGATNDDGDLYAPSLADPDAFDIDQIQLVGGTPGSSGLYDVHYEVVLPDWVRFAGASGYMSTGFMNGLTLPALGAKGGTASGTLKSPLGKSAAISKAIYAANPAPPVSLSATTTYATTSFIIPCADLATIDFDRTTNGLQLAPGSQLFQLRLSGNERVVAANGEVAWVPHSLELPPYNPFYNINLAAACPTMGVGTNNAKSISTLPSEIAASWGITWYPPTNYYGGFGDFAVLDYVPPYQELRAAPGTNASVLGEPWLCVLPKPATITPTYLGVCPEAANTTDPNLPADPFNTSRIVCTGGAPYDHRVDLGVYFDPRSRDMAVPYDEGGLAWDGTNGCMRSADVCFAANTRRVYDTCAVGTGGKLALAHDVTAVIWRSDGADTAAVDGWRTITLGSAGEPLAPPILSLTVPVWNQSFVPQLTTDEKRVAHIFNLARFYGGDFDPDGAGPIPTQSLGAGTFNPGNGTALNWRAQNFGRGLIDNRFTITTTLFNSETHFVARGDSLWLGSTVLVSGNYGRVPVDGLEIHYDLPVGFNPGNTATSTLPTRLTAPLAVPPNPVGLSGPLVDAFVILPTQWQAPAPTALSDFDISLHWIDAPSGGFWQYRFKRLTPSRGFVNTGLIGGIHIAVSPRVDYPFVNTTNYPVVISATAIDYDRQTDNNREAWPDDPDDWATSLLNVNVPMTASLSTVTSPTCLPGLATPSFFVDYANTSGVNQYGTQVVFALPSPVGGLPLVFGGFYEEAGWAPAGTTHVVQVATGTRNALDPTIVWTDLGAYAGPAADITLVRIAFGTANTAANLLPAYYAGGRFRVDLVHPSATVADVGKQFTAGVNIGSSQVVMSNSLQSAPAIIGACPLALTVDKWLDEDKDGTPNATEPVIAGVDFRLSLTGGAPSVPRADQDGTTDAAGQASFVVYPGQTPTLFEPVPEPEDVSIAGYPDAGGTLTWAPTTPGGTTQVGPVVGFVTPAHMAFGNMCSCTTANLCIASARCVVELVAEPEGDAPPVAAHCEFTPKTLACDPADAELCEVASGACDPATGACGLAPRTCEQGAPTRIYVTIDDDQGPIGVARCWVGSDGAVSCDTRDEAGITVLDVTPELVCGEADPSTTPVPSEEK